MLRKKPKVLHISCHGVKTKVRKNNIFEDQPCLLFEDESGKGELLSDDELDEFLKKEVHKLDLVYLAACDSEEIAKIFLKNGAKQVICTKND